MRLPLAVALVCALAGPAAAAGVLQLHPKNAHYFLYRGKAAVLVTSGEHYGAVINRSFDYRRYLAELQSKHLNLTRVWTGAYREVAGNFNITDNTLAPSPQNFVTPWPRSSTPGALDGGNRFDLASWNPAFFDRLRDFLREAEKRGVIAELNLFCPYYEESMWQVSPLNAKNNVNGIGDVARTDVLALKDARLTEVQDALVRKLVSEVRDFGNVYFEICNEPYFGGVTLPWQRHIAQTIHDAERDGARHLISQNIANGSVKVADPDPNVSIFNFHYSRPPLSVGMNFDLGRAIGMNETGFDGNSDAAYRLQAWDFLVAGGALYNNLDYSFTAGHEDGSFQYPARTPGGGSARLREQLAFLARFFAKLDLVRMKPDAAVTARSTVENGNARALSDGRRFVIYVQHGHIEGQPPRPRYVVDSAERTSELHLVLPAGRYRATWLDPKTGREISRAAARGGEIALTTPRYAEDLVLEVR
jgi:hypothetical protein